MIRRHIVSSKAQYLTNKCESSYEYNHICGLVNTSISNSNIMR